MEDLLAGKEAGVNLSSGLKRAGPLGTDDCPVLATGSYLHSIQLSSFLKLRAFPCKIMHDSVLGFFLFCLVFFNFFIDEDVVALLIILKEQAYTRY